MQSKLLWVIFSGLNFIFCGIMALDPSTGSVSVWIIFLALWGFLFGFMVCMYVAEKLLAEPLRELIAELEGTVEKHN